MCLVEPSLSALLTRKYTGNAFDKVKGKLLPSVGLKKIGEHVRANFGQTPFMFDIDTLMKACILCTFLFDIFTFFFISVQFGTLS